MHGQQNVKTQCFISDSDTFSNNTLRTHYCLSIAAVITLTSHSFTLHLYYLPHLFASGRVQIMAVSWTRWCAWGAG